MYHFLSKLEILPLSQSIIQASEPVKTLTFLMPSTRRGNNNSIFKSYICTGQDLNPWPPKADMPWFPLSSEPVHYSILFQLLINSLKIIFSHQRVKSKLMQFYFSIRLNPSLKPWYISYFELGKMFWLTVIFLSIFFIPNNSNFYVKKNLIVTITWCILIGQVFNFKWQQVNNEM